MIICVVYVYCCAVCCVCADVLEEVQHCFSADTVAECRKRVQQAALTSKGVTVGDWTQDNWAVRALAQWDTIADPALVEVRALASLSGRRALALLVGPYCSYLYLLLVLQEWFRMTKAAASGPIGTYYQLEAEKA